jgi:hypothetical protein
LHACQLLTAHQLPAMSACDECRRTPARPSMPGCRAYRRHTDHYTHTHTVAGVVPNLHRNPANQDSTPRTHAQNGTPHSLMLLTLAPHCLMALLFASKAPAQDGCFRLGEDAKGSAYDSVQARRAHPTAPQPLCSAEGPRATGVWTRRTHRRHFALNAASAASSPSAQGLTEPTAEYSIFTVSPEQSLQVRHCRCRAQTNPMFTPHRPPDAS